MAQEVRDSNRNASEYTAMKFNTSKIDKAINTIYADHLKNRALRDSDKLAIPYATQDQESKETARKLIEDIGFDAVYFGDLTQTKIMDPDQKVYGQSVSSQELEKMIS